MITWPVTPLMLIVLVTSTSCAWFIPTTEVKPDGEQFYLLTHPDKRFANPDKYFTHEYERINIRRTGTSSINRPSKLVGLALSGGGIRSAAFQLGLLSGLNRAQHEGKSLLKRMDYISSVSGGSWANGAYWAWDKSDEEMFTCLDRAADKGLKEAEDEGCSPAVLNMLRTYQGVLIVPLTTKKGKLEFMQRKEGWEKAIEHYYLSPDRDIKFWKFDWNNPDYALFHSKHYPIFNSTHDGIKEEGIVENSPFETTPDYIGTIIDLNSQNRSGKTYCQQVRDDSNLDKKIKDEILDEECPEAKQGFFVQQNTKDFSWWNRKWQRYWKVWVSQPDERGATLKKTMAHSSGVVGVDKPWALAYNFDLRYQNQYVSSLRDSYQLADGGKSDNLGLIPLVERSLDVIIVSYMGKDAAKCKNEESKNKCDDSSLQYDLEDFHLANAQVNKLFDCKFEKEHDEYDLLFFGSYTCKNGTSGKMIHVRPVYENIQVFKEALEEGNICGNSQECKIVSDFLKDPHKKKEMKLDKEDRFPQSQTIDFEYEEELIRAYYLLGRYIAVEMLNKEIVEQLS